MSSESTLLFTEASTADTKPPVVIISGTNRPDSTSRQLANYYQLLLRRFGAESVIVDLHELPGDFTVSALYHNNGKSEGFNQVRQQLDKAEKFVFVVPEYNGSFPGVLKAFIDGLPYPNGLLNKKAALVGLSSNPHGAALALSHLNDIFSYLGMNTLALRVKLGQIRTHFSEGTITNAFYQELLELQARQLIDF
ncbi:hypothetical protein GCM10027275_28630 [Rhabdobacter roseus]|uniref:NAD(P)H-dependent FMN reductase n=1 Tax=Rhabdobacter roseus TaxID=1655419 RepID=A0A840TTD0_9BACT|nr:NAD(P)H-dependent oxidoreductase [Rhabdobacter roseus]MBB5284812.1 NAD(P)H-dependent FMN reductase [Rhabdobacter roseus]